jgi:hypothetical protein
LAEKAGATLITQVKGNQKSLQKQIIHGTKIQRAVDFFEEPVDKAHGRIEQRKYEVFEINPMLNKWRKDWPYIRRVIRVTRFRSWKINISYYVSNGILSAQEFGKYIRRHWFIENKLHYVKDTAFREDKCCKRVNPYVFSSLIDWAINLLKLKNVKSINQELYINTMNLEAAMKYVF